MEHLERRSVLTKLQMLAIVAAVAAAVVAAGRAHRAAAGPFDFQHSIIVGLAMTASTVTGPWHGTGVAGSTDTSAGSNLDLSNYPNDPGTLPGTAVYWQSHGMDPPDPFGSFYNRDMAVYAGIYTGSCTAVTMNAYDGSTGVYLGSHWFVHIQPDMAASQGLTASGAPYTWSIKLMGTVLGAEVCAAWTGPHLHQGGQNVGTNLYTNWGVDDYGVINPTGDWQTNWMHRFMWGDPPQ